ncbi:hypothetical protein RW092_17095 [Paenibacillus sp. 3LSP]|uniref:hypothetical protein n=1 Tax=Paenibacillus sp. 3LSP TaxID=2800795 RepID=UPI0028FD2DB7|nr:hypothetical protein [Paenibacillus sp. 3LSP]MDU0331896.1 hypothetical protein [Paenibacillus sp. 3LSP]
MISKKMKALTVFSLLASLLLLSLNSGVYAAETNLSKRTLDEISAVYDSLPKNLKQNKANLIDENIMIYDESGRIKNEIHSDGRIYDIQWDNDRIIQVTDTAGYKTGYDYSKNGQVVENIFYNNQLQTSYFREKELYQINLGKFSNAEATLKDEIAKQYSQGLVDSSTVNRLENSSVTPFAVVDYYVAGKRMNSLLSSSDFLYNNDDAMTESEIQSFLTSKNSVLRNSIKIYAINSSGNAYDTGRTVKPSKVISDAAKNAGINPRVILVTLQKESSLVTSTDTNVNRRAFHYAMGYGATDSGDITTYTGFDKQVELASAWMYDKWLHDSKLDVFLTVNGGVSKTSGGVTYAGKIQVDTFPAWVLYTYTPHVIDYSLLPTIGGGNYLFLKVFEGWWNSWYD